VGVRASVAQRVRSVYVRANALRSARPRFSIADDVVDIWTATSPGRRALVVIVRKSRTGVGVAGYAAAA
jgi:hypothetical protein